VISRLDTMKHMGDIGLIGLGVMGRNLALNMNDRGIRVVAYNRTASTQNEFLGGPAKGTLVMGARSPKNLVSRLSRPRRVMLMVRAGKPVDDAIRRLLPLLQPGDIVIDGGNSHFRDTARRAEELERKGLLYVGAGISGGEEGARGGPSIMPGGSPGAWPHVKDLFRSIAAKAADGSPCCEWMGAGGSGHYVKMVHNGIEYGEMQAVGEAYQGMLEGLRLSHPEMSGVFSRWNRGELASYLIGITAEILAVRGRAGGALVEEILDVTRQNQTGAWAAASSLELSVPFTTVAESIHARFLSALKEDREKASVVLKYPAPRWAGDRRRHMAGIRSALLGSRIICYTQGFMLLREASREYGWNLDFAEIARIWRNGCIIRCVMLERMKEAFEHDPELRSLLLDPYFRNILQRNQKPWRRVVEHSIRAGIPVPLFSSAIAFYDGYRRARLPANLLQAQRDYFGAHGYERTDRPRGEFFHTEWKREQKLRR
jgi:6-phosphogluconate dehydrogenase